MTFKQLAKEITKREGKKQQVNIAQVSEILKCLIEIAAELQEWHWLLPKLHWTSPGTIKKKHRRKK